MLVFLSFSFLIHVNDGVAKEIKCELVKSLMLLKVYLYNPSTSFDPDLNGSLKYLRNS